MTDIVLLCLVVVVMGSLVCIAGYSFWLDYELARVYSDADSVMRLTRELALLEVLCPVQPLNTSGDNDVEK